jgi:hypothetical protein
MVDHTRNERGFPHPAPSPDPKRTQNAARKARFEAIREAKRLPRVRVLPATEELRRVLRHPRGMAFRSSGAVEWPMDKFTANRLRDGDITIEAPRETKGQPPKQPAHTVKSEQAS